MRLHTNRLTPLLAGLALAAGCASSPDVPESFGFDDVPIAEESTPLGGAALACARASCAARTGT